VEEIVMVVADLYLPRDAATEEGTQAAGPGAAGAPLPAIESAGRFGTHTRLRHGWREWLVREVGRPELGGVAPACIAAATLGRAPAAGVTPWIATPVYLNAGLTRVHLDHRGLLHLARAESAALASAFTRSFGGTGLALAPLDSGDFLLETAGIAACATPEPARCAGGAVSEVLPRTPEAAPLRRLASEIEMWLHAEPLNAARAARGELPVSALWLWGAAGRRPPAGSRAGADAPPLPEAFGRDAWLRGLWRLGGSACRPLPEHFGELVRGGAGARAVVVAEVSGEGPRAGGGSAAAALAHLDGSFVSPALAALRRGDLARVTLIVNDTAATLRRASHWQLWRRRRAGIAGFA
jgi:hypothetical protein